MKRQMLRYYLSILSVIVLIILSFIKLKIKTFNLNAESFATSLSGVKDEDFYNESPIIRFKKAL
jgi:hypothetical protein